MPTFKTRSEFTAHCRVISALHHLYNLVDASARSPSDLLPVVVFMAFSIESYINHLGFVYNNGWDKKEKCSWKEKLNILHEKRGKKTDWGADPLQFANEIFKLRNRLAHGKPEPVEGPEFSSHREAFEYIDKNDMDPQWFENINDVWLAKSQKRFEELMEYMATLYGLSPTNYFHASTKSIIGPYE